MASWIGKDSLQAEYAWLKFLAGRLPTEKVVVPRPYSALIDDGDITLLIMEYLDGVTLQQYLCNGGQLDQALLDQLVDAYLAFRSVQSPYSGCLCPSGSWEMHGHIFPPDGDGFVTVKTICEFDSLIQDCLHQASGRSGLELNKFDVVLNHGELHYSSWIKMSDGRLGLIDFAEAVWARGYWDLAALECTPYNDFKTAFTDALRTRGIWLGRDALDDIYGIIGWYVGEGGKGWLKQRAKMQEVKA